LRDTCKTKGPIKKKIAENLQKEIEGKRGEKELMMMMEWKKDGTVVSRSSLFFFLSLPNLSCNVTQRNLNNFQFSIYI
jgi:hypothetical protein